MAELILDGFDQYGPNGSNSFNTAIPLLTTLLPYYTNYLGYMAGFSIGPNLGGTGQSLQISGANGGGNTYTYLSRSLGSNVTRIIGGMYVSTTNLTAVGISFVEGVSEQCCIMITATTGIVKLLTNNAGSAIATSTIAVSTNTSVLKHRVILMLSGKKFFVTKT